MCFFMKIFRRIYHVRFPIVTTVPLTPFPTIFLVPQCFICFVLLCFGFFVSHFKYLDGVLFLFRGTSRSFIFIFFLLFLFIYFIHLFFGYFDTPFFKSVELSLQLRTQPDLSPTI
ncbi:hypothetical protein I7I50_11176 [Histoplasma capsulatum G186AR]|uniref:Uncharacterized protein n=1 Tax=Ajellomyces capsulatus TaxID=5037 RepID=A0A8H7ZAS0_AJECA|nr:hypothetical protein I7I52_02414 [Histoplasma capsulatum]QSS69768.1 hypothetical protein I7I50_11176 [Histoplasma capsulatum G186AR]